MNLPKIHFADNYLLNPTNPLTVNLIGAGGTGHRMLTELARMHVSLLALGHPGLQVNLFDDDKVSEANIGRQMFAETEIGRSKAVVLIERINRFCGTNWKAVTEKFGTQTLHLLPAMGRANIYVTCVDTVKARFDIAEVLRKSAGQNRMDRDKALYWLDMGNSRFTGQVILSTLHPIKQPSSEKFQPVSCLPLVTDEFKEMLEAVDDSDEPSCSAAEALKKQDLYINSTIANYGASLLWQLMQAGMVECRGVFVNLQNYRTTPLMVV
ncbi:MAG: PRTRC system ThiF family protein [Mucilaginibacter sp.]|nr:PRTRC system ThiF family protein [Mucilaginibacter sp.]